MQFYNTIVKADADPYVMLDEDTTYTTGDGPLPASQHSVVGRESINLDLEISVFRGKQLQVRTQEFCFFSLSTVLTSSLLALARFGGYPSDV